MKILSPSLLILGLAQATSAATAPPPIPTYTVGFTETSVSVDQGQGTVGARPAPPVYEWNMDPNPRTTAEERYSLSPAQLAHVRKLNSYPKIYKGLPLLNDTSSGIILEDDPNLLLASIGSDPLCVPTTTSYHPIVPQHGYWGKARRDASGNVVYKSPGTPFIEYDFTHNGWVEDFHAGLIDIAQFRKDTAEIILIGDSITYFWDSSQVLRLGNMRPETAQKNIRYGYHKAMPEFCSDTITWAPKATITSTMPVPDYLYKPVYSKDGYFNNTTVNMGIPGDRVEHVLWRLDHGALDNLAPKVVVLAIGTNNCNQVLSKTSSAERVAEGLQRCVDSIRNRCPNAGIVVVKPLPRDVTTGAMFKAAKSIGDAMMNKPFVLDTSTYSMVKVLDLWNDSGLTKDGGTRVDPLLYKDFSNTTSMMSCLHLNDNGYIRYAEALSPVVKSLIVNNQGVINGTRAMEVQISSVNKTQHVYIPFQVTGSAVQGEDYELLTKSPLVVPMGATRSRITIAIKNTRVAHAARQLQLTLGAPQDATGSQLNGVTLNANSSTTLTITGNEGLNRAPIASDISADAFNDTATVIPLQGTDSDGTVVGYTCTPPHSGSVVVNGAQATYTPTPGFVGTDTFTYTAIDELGAESSPQNIVVTVTTRTPNHPPVAPSSLANSTVAAVVGLPFIYQIPAFTDPDAATGLSVVAYHLSDTLPAGLTYDQSSRTINGTPTTVGYATMTVTATDDAAASTAVNFTIAVDEVLNSKTVYDDAVQPGWKLTQLGATANATNTISGTFRGNTSMSVLVTYTSTEKAYVSFDAIKISNNYLTTFPLTGYDAVTFWAHGGTNGGQRIKLQAKLGNGTLVSGSLPTLKAGWMPITYRLSDLFGTTPIQPISSLRIINVDCTNKVFYIDDLKFGTLPVIGGAG